MNDITNLTELAFLFPSTGKANKPIRSATPGIRHITKNAWAKYNKELDTWDIFSDPKGENAIGSAVYLLDAVALAEELTN